MRLLNSLKIVKQYLKNRNWKLVVMVLLLGIASSLCMLTQLFIENKNNTESQIIDEAIIVRNVMEYASIEPELIPQVMKIDGIEAITKKRVIPLFLASGENILGTYEFFIISDQEMEQDIQIGNSLLQSISQTNSKEITVSYKEKILELIAVEEGDITENRISKKVVIEQLEDTLDHLPIRQLELKVEKGRKASLLKEELLKYGLVWENEKEKQLHKTILMQSDLLSQLYTVIKSILVIITIGLVLLLIKIRKKNIGILRILGYGKATIITGLVVEYVIRFGIATAFMLFFLGIELLLGKGMGAVNLTLTFSNILMSYGTIFLICGLFGSIVSFLFGEILLWKNSLEIIKH